MKQIDRYAVIGHPILHSKSPFIHQHFARQTSQNLTYEAIDAPLDGFEETLEEFRSQGGKGVNITVPFKQQAWQFSGRNDGDQRSERAELAGAVNTLVFREDGTVFGDTTDGTGLVRDITINLGWQLRHKSILVVGAGGAVRGVLQNLLEAEPASLVICNRTHEKAEQLATLFSGLGPIKSKQFEHLDRPFDVIINGTAASLDQQLPAISVSVFAPHSRVYDMMYSSETTVFNKWALQQGVTDARDGLGMLVEQAAESFCLWRGVRPTTNDLIKEMGGDSR